MSGTFTWEEWKKYLEQERREKILSIQTEFDDPYLKDWADIRFDTLLQKDPDEVFEHTITHLGYKQGEMIEKFGCTGIGKSTFGLGQMFENNIRPRTGKSSHWFDNTVARVAQQGDDQWVEIHCPDLMMDIDLTIPNSKELNEMLQGQIYGLSVDSLYIDEIQDSEEPKKKKNMREDVRSFLNKGRKW